ncbi:hypothetical protein [Microvirga sp. Mcv34]|uniref:hypothetical protein n=1 Tax=Microvirga sp. Mcv34 TaxID=2926016 RepID=UPI0021C75BBB|nr:hypothetical protein [Microvirga sp. Mcv34]
MTSVAQDIIHGHFNRKTLTALKKKGIEVVKSTFVPGPGGDYTQGETAYVVVENEMSSIRSYLEVLKMAA